MDIIIFQEKVRQELAHLKYWNDEDQKHLIVGAKLADLLVHQEQVYDYIKSSQSRGVGVNETANGIVPAMTDFVKAPLVREWIDYGIAVAHAMVAFDTDINLDLAIASVDAYPSQHLLLECMNANLSPHDAAIKLRDFELEFIKKLFKDAKPYSFAGSVDASGDIPF